MPVTLLPGDVKQKVLPTPKGCAAAIVIVIPDAAVLSASPVTSGPDATEPWADAVPRFANVLTVKVFGEGTLVMGQGAL